MTKEIKIVLALALLPILSIATLALIHPFRSAPSLEAPASAPTLGWLALLPLAILMTYSYRKRVIRQGIGSLYAWKIVHSVSAYLFLILLFMHTNGWMGMESQLFLSTVSIGIAISGLFGIVIQGLYPEWMTRTLVDSVYKDELKDDVSELLNEISKNIDGRSEDFEDAYQRHILNYVTINQPTIKIYEDMRQRLLGKSSEHTHAAVRDLATLTTEEKEVFTQVIYKALELMEIRLNQAYQRRMNGWLSWHTALSVLLLVALFFHIMADFYY